MRMDSDKDRSKDGRDDMITDESINRKKSCVKSLGIQRCNSDGVLAQQNGFSKRKPASKSSSEASINGVQDFQEILTMQAHANGCVTDAACALDNNNLSLDNESGHRKRVNGIKKDIINRQTQSKKDGCNVKCVKTWSHRAVERRRTCTRTDGSRQDDDPDEDQIAVLINGMELNVDLSAGSPDYLSNVCSTYRQEADLLYGRTRGGVKNTNHHVIHSANSLSGRLENGNGVEEMLDSDQEHANRSDSSNETPPPNFLMVVAPLAVPENLSDEESVSCGSSLENHSRPCVSDRQCENDADSVISERDRSIGLDNTDVRSYMNGDANLVADESNVSSHPENISNGAQSECDDKSYNEKLESEQDIEHEALSTSEGNEETVTVEKADQEVVENVEQALEVEQTRPSSSSSFDSIDDIGDFIEADLPPNAERLAFFARESSSSSTTDEDEGCGDEVLPNPNEDEESENETIDPLTHAEQHNLSGDRVNESGMKLLNNTSAELLSYSNDFTRSPYAFMNARAEGGGCNIACNKSTDDNEGIGDYPDSAHSGHWGDRDEFSVGASNHQYFGILDSSRVEQRTSSLLKGENNCVSCDKPVDEKLQRVDELGVIVCDKCYNERDLDRNRKSENVVRKKIRTVSHSSSAGRLVYRNNNLRANSQDKVNNASNFSVRLSSSDSDPFERLYVSDSSEMVSPDVDTGVESVFPSSSTSSDGTSVQYNQINSMSGCSEDGRLPGSLAFHRQSMSLEYDTPEEVLYCPYYTRRSRSLDQELSLNGTCTKSPEREPPNISVTSSNFQDDESNNQEKVFEKQPYNVEAPIPTYSSSDEEENTRVPAPYSNHSDIKGVEGAGAQSASMNSLVYMHGVNSHEYEMTPQNIIVADEPIYEDIEDLELLLDEGTSDGETENRSPAQPLFNAISKLRRKKRSRSPVTDVEKVMIWNEYEAYVVQVKQIATSACGPTAVLNVLKAFDFQLEKEEVTQKITSALRMEAAPIPYYLFSRYSAGTTAQALVDGVCTVTRGAIKGKFFHFYPKRDVELLKWLGHWMKKGAVPIATLNLQRGVKPGWTIPDVWHHQMIYGVSSKGVYLTNPLEIVPESIIMEQLSSDSVLLVRKQDVVSRFRDWCPLNEILKQRDPRWMTMNVLGQIVHMLREQCMPQEQLSTMRSQLTSHICIPAAYKAGIILYMRSNSEFFDELMQTPELPLKHPTDSS